MISIHIIAHDAGAASDWYCSVLGARRFKQSSQFRQASCVVVPEHACGGTDHLLVGHVTNVLAEPPTVTERVDDLPVALTPEHVAKRLVDLCAAVDGALPQAVDVVGRDVQRTVGPPTDWGDSTP
jgi:hypothetical protein